MRIWLRRLAYLLLLLLWLAIMSFPAMAFVLATRNQIQIGGDPAQHLRLFRISERDAQGIGIERAFWTEEPPNCVQTNVTFLMWEGDSESIVSCQCLDEGGGVVYMSQAACSEE